MSKVPTDRGSSPHPPMPDRQEFYQVCSPCRRDGLKRPSSPEIPAAVKLTSPPRTSPSKTILKLPGLQPTSCEEPEPESAAEDRRDAYRKAEKWIRQHSSNCCTIESDHRVRFWKATESPVKLETVDKDIIFMHRAALKVENTE